MPAYAGMSGGDYAFAANFSTLLAGAGFAAATFGT